MEYLPIVMVDLSGMLDAWCTASSQPLDGTGRSAGVYGRSHEHDVSNHAACGGPSGVAHGRGGVGRTGRRACAQRGCWAATRGDGCTADWHRLVGGPARSVDATILPLAKPRPTPENQEKLAGREVSSWWLIPVAIDGDPTQRESYQPLGRIPYYEFLRRLPQDKGFKLDATRMVIAPLDHTVVRMLGQAAD